MFLEIKKVEKENISLISKHTRDETRTPLKRR